MLWSRASHLRRHLGGVRRWASQVCSYATAKRSSYPGNNALNPLRSLQVLSTEGGHLVKYLSDRNHCCIRTRAGQFQPAPPWISLSSTPDIQQKSVCDEEDTGQLREVQNPSCLEASSTLKKRRLKMNKHKYRKRRKRDRKRNK